MANPKYTITRDVSVGIADAAPAPAAAVATTVASNYGTCTEFAQRLTDLQAWVKAQQDAKP